MNDITPKEAIEYLLFMKHNVKEHSKQDKALDLAIKALENPTGDCISREALKKTINSSIAEATEAGMVVNADYLWELLNYAIDNAPAAETYTLEDMQNNFDAGVDSVIGKYDRPQGECKTCIHRDPEDKKCDCGALERHGCPFPVSDDYFCKFYEKGGAK